jgi:hypothetical protein
MLGENHLSIRIGTDGMLTLTMIYLGCIAAMLGLVAMSEDRDA